MRFLTGNLQLWLVAAGIAAMGHAVAQRTPRPSSGPDPETMQGLIETASKTKDRHSDELFRLPAVVGHGIALSKETPRKPVIRVYVSRNLTEDEGKAFPKELEGVRVEVVETGSFHALSTDSKEKPATRDSAQRAEKSKHKSKSDKRSGKP